MAFNYMKFSDKRTFRCLGCGRACRFAEASKGCSGCSHYLFEVFEKEAGRAGRTLMDEYEEDAFSIHNDVRGHAKPISEYRDGYKLTTPNDETPGGVGEFGGSRFRGLDGPRGVSQNDQEYDIQRGRGPHDIPGSYHSKIDEALSKERLRTIDDSNDISSRWVDPVDPLSDAGHINNLLDHEGELPALEKQLRNRELQRIMPHDDEDIFSRIVRQQKGVR